MNDILASVIDIGFGPKGRKLLLLLGTVVLLTASCIETYSSWLAEQQELMAQELGVNMEDYGPALRFPYGYLRARLGPGMSPREVHQIVPSHEAVYRCRTETIPEEIYYFFSADDEKAVRIAIVYDERGRYQFTDPEDRNSHRLSPEGCEPGYLPEE